MRPLTKRRDTMQKVSEIGAQGGKQPSPTSSRTVESPQEAPEHVGGADA